MFYLLFIGCRLFLLVIYHRFPAELIKVDISGRRFERMCTARKSMNVIQQIDIGDENNLNDDVQTVKRRSRSRKPRHKRRNTIAGTDQKEIEEAVKGYVNHIIFLNNFFSSSPVFIYNNDIFITICRLYFCIVFFNKYYGSH